MPLLVTRLPPCRQANAGRSHAGCGGRVIRSATRGCTVVDGRLHEEADKFFSPDSCKSNATSIVLVLERRGRRVLLTGDSTSSELVSGLALLDGGIPVALGQHAGQRA